MSRFTVRVVREPSAPIRYIEAYGGDYRDSRFSAGLLDESVFGHAVVTIGVEDREGKARHCRCGGPHVIVLAPSDAADVGKALVELSKQAGAA